MTKREILAGLINKTLSKDQALALLATKKKQDDTFIVRAKKEYDRGNGVVSIPLSVFLERFKESDPENPIYSLYTTKKRYVLQTGGRASLKTTGTLRYCAAKLYQHGEAILFTRYTAESLKDSLEDFKTVIDQMEDEGHLVASDFTFTATVVRNNVTGSFMTFKGLKPAQKKQTARLKGLSAKYNTVIIEEAEEFTDKRAFTKLDGSIRTAGKDNKIVFLMNPTTKDHFVYTNYITDFEAKKDWSGTIKVHGFDVTVSKHSQVEHIHTTYHKAADLGYLDPSWVANVTASENAMEEAVIRAANNAIAEGKTKEEVESLSYTIKHTSDYYYEYIGGWLERAEGVCFPNWQMGKFDFSLPSVVALDYGYFPDPLAAVRVAIDKKKKYIYVRTLIYKYKLDDVAAELLSVGVNKIRDLIVADTNEKRTTRTLKNTHKFNIETVVKTLAKEGVSGIVIDIREINKWTIIVDEDDPNKVYTIRELNTYKWNNDKKSIPLDKNNHVPDCIRYAFNRLNRPKKRGVRRRN